jgi:hypothetical protein
VASLGTRHWLWHRDCARIATLGTIRFEGRFDYAAIGTVSNVASRLCDEAKPGQILISPRVLTKVENAVKVDSVGEFELKGIRRPLAAYNVLAAVSLRLRRSKGPGYVSSAGKQVPSITLNADFKYSAVTVPFRRCISSTMRARQRAWQA